MKKNKNVTNLLMNISKLRDILDEGIPEKIFAQQYLLEKTKEDIKRQVHKYVLHEKHELDFNSEDIKALAEGLTKIENKLPKIKYSVLSKEVMDIIPLTDDNFGEFCTRLAPSFYYGKYVKQIADDLHFYALVTYLWAESEYKKDFMEQITQHLMSFL